MCYTIFVNRKGCIIWTSDSTTITKLNKLCKTAPGYYRLVKETTLRNGESAGSYYELKDKSLISFRSKKATDGLTEEQLQKLKERALANFKNKVNSPETQSIESDQ